MAIGAQEALRSNPTNRVALPSSDSPFIGSGTTYQPRSFAEARAYNAEQDRLFEQNRALRNENTRLEEALKQKIDRRKLFRRAGFAVAGVGTAAVLGYIGYEGHKAMSTPLDLPPTPTPEPTPKPTAEPLMYGIATPEATALPEIPLDLQVEGFSVRIPEEDILSLVHATDSQTGGQLRPDYTVEVQYTNAILVNENQIAKAGYDENHDNKLSLSTTVHEAPNREQPTSTDLIFTALPIGDPQLVIRDAKTGEIVFQPLILPVEPASEYPSRRPGDRLGDEVAVLSEESIETDYALSIAVDNLYHDLTLANTFGANINTIIITNNPIVGDIIYNDQKYGIVLNQDDVDSQEYPNPGFIEMHLKAADRIYKNAELTPTLYEYKSLFESIDAIVTLDEKRAILGSPLVRHNYLEIFNQVDDAVKQGITPFATDNELFDYVLVTLQDGATEFITNYTNNDENKGMVLTQDDKDQVQQLVNFVTAILEEQSDGTWTIDHYIPKLPEIKALFAA